MANNKKPFYKRFWFWIIVVLILVFVGANSSSTSKTSKQNTSNNSTKKVTTSSSSKEASKPRNSKPKSTKTTIDKKLEARLKEDQGFADQGNASFAFSKYAYKITTNKNNELNIYVTGDFLQLSESQRNEVGRKLQAMGNSTLYEENKIDDDEYREKPITTFYLNKNVSVGVSQAFDHSKFHWNKKN